MKNSLNSKKTLSCGVLILNSNDQILGCKPFGKFDGRNDIPKGKMESGETPILAAIRETFEETGINLNESDLETIGQFPYMSKKDLYLFKTKMEIEDLSVLKCHMRFKLNGNEFPEMDGYEWIHINDIDHKFYCSLVPILNKLLK
jgi:predicted NUDIX family NTP pyrophosphohydrolase